MQKAARSFSETVYILLPRARREEIPPSGFALFHHCKPHRGVVIFTPKFPVAARMSLVIRMIMVTMASVIIQSAYSYISEVCLSEKNSFVADAVSAGV